MSPHCKLYWRARSGSNVKCYNAIGLQCRVLSSRFHIHLLHLATLLDKMVTDSSNATPQAYDRDPNLPSLLVDDEFAQELVDRQGSWRKVLQLAIGAGISTAGMTAR
jgi:hypothetical protein